jgi:hypothetical protein
VATVSEAARAWVPPLELGRRSFRIGVGVVALGLAATVLALLDRRPPHEDETLVLFVGRGSLGDVLRTVLGHRGGAPLHFLLGWAIVHLGGGLTALRIASGVFAVAALPVIAMLGSRLAGRAAGLLAAALAAASWAVLFHAIYGRMYSLFLLTSALSYLALATALERGGRRRFTLWGLALLATIATHPYGALVLAAQVLSVLTLRRRLRSCAVTLAGVAVACTPFWWADAVLRGRFDAGLGGGGRLGNARSLLDYLGSVAGDFSAGWKPVRALVLVLALAGFVLLARRSRDAVLLVAPVFLVPALAFLVVRLGGTTSPESRHLIFALPFFALLVALALVRIGVVLRPAGLVVPVVATAALMSAEVAWAWHKTPPLFRGEPSGQAQARRDATGWLAARSRADDVLLGYEPLFLAAWERRPSVSREVIPRADPALAADALHSFSRPLGHGVWIFDASDTTNLLRRQTIPLVVPEPAGDFDVARFGPYLLIRTRRPLATPQQYVRTAERVLTLGRDLGIGDADIALHTIMLAGDRF